MTPVTLHDLRAAVAARLHGIDDSRAMQAAHAIFSLVNVGEGAPLPENALAAILTNFGISTTGNIVVLGQALLALAADEAECWHLFYPAANLVHQVEQQAARARCRRGGDALDVLMREAIERYPRFSPSMLWAEFCRRASTPQIRDEALSSYDSLLDTLAFEPYPGAELSDISYSAFRKRYSRIKKSLRHEPANVPVAPDDAHHQQFRKAA